MKKRWIIGLASTLVVLGIGGYAISDHLHRITKTATQATSESTSSTSTKTSTVRFTGHWTPIILAQVEKHMSKQDIAEQIGTLDPFKLVDGMHFKLQSTNDPTAKKYIGEEYSFDFMVYTHDGETFPLVLSFNNGKNTPMMLVNMLSAYGWSQYFEAKGVPAKLIAEAYTASPQYIFQCTSGPQFGKTVVVKNFTDWNNYMKQTDSTMKGTFVG